MNIQQVNGSGHNIWIFAVTSVVALSVTGLTGYFIEEINKIRISLRKISKEWSRRSFEQQLGFSHVYALVACAEWSCFVDVGNESLETDLEQ